jgi:hypothetical protein
MDNLQSERLKHSNNVYSILKISLGLVLFTMISYALVYGETISVDIEGNSFDIDYTATGLTVSGIEPDLDFISLILTVDVTDSSGTLNITFDRSFFDSIFKGADDDFIILADGDEPNFTETETTAQSRTLSIELLAGTEEVEIIGSVFGDSAPVVEPPVEEPPVEEPPVEEPPVVVPPVVKPPVVVPPKTQCGPGTVLKDGTCVLDERCGPGTVLKDGACVLESTPKSSETSVKGMGKELITGIVAALVIAGVIGIILGLISRASKS